MVTINNKKYYLDLTFDLYRIQKGMRTNYFANDERYETISKEELEQIDIKLGYCKNGMYMDDVIEMIKKEMQDEKAFAEE